MSKYEPLRHFLIRNGSGEIPLQFSDIEYIIGAPLPPVALKHRAWWSNNPSNSVITHAWLQAGYKTERVDMASRRLVFRRAPSGLSRPDSPPASRSNGILSRLREALGGTVRVGEGVDVTAPTDENWDASR